MKKTTIIFAFLALALANPPTTVVPSPRPEKNFTVIKPKPKIEKTKLPIVYNCGSGLYVTEVRRPRERYNGPTQSFTEKLRGETPRPTELPSPRVHICWEQYWNCKILL